MFDVIPIGFAAHTFDISTHCWAQLPELVKLGIVYLSISSYSLPKLYAISYVFCLKFCYCYFVILLILLFCHFEFERNTNKASTT